SGTVSSATIFSGGGVARTRIRADLNAPASGSTGGSTRSASAEPSRATRIRSYIALPVHQDRCSSDPEGERFRRLAGHPPRRPLQRLNRPRLVDVEDRVELVRETRQEVVADPLGVGSVDHADRSL